MGSGPRSHYLDRLGSHRTSSLSNKQYEDLLTTTHMRTTSGISSLYPTRALPGKAASPASTGTGLGSSVLRKSLSGASSTDSPMSATGHRPPSKAQRTSTGGSSAEEFIYKGRFTSPARSLNRSLSAARAASFAADRPASTSKSRPAAGMQYSKSSAAPLQSYPSLAPAHVTRSSAASAAHPSSQPLPTPKPTASHTPTQTTRRPAPASSSTTRSQRLEKLCAAYTDPAGKPSTSRSISVGRRSSSDIAASLNRSLDLGTGSLGARSQPLQPLTSAGSANGRSAGGSQAVEPYPARSSSRSRGSQETALSRLQQQDQLSSARSAQQSQLSSAEEGRDMLSAVESSRGMFGDSASSSSMSGRSSLLGRRSSRGVLEDEVTSTRADRGMPLTSESAAEVSSVAPILARQSSTSSRYQTTYQTAYSSPASGLHLRKLSFKHDAHGDRVAPSTPSDLIQAVPSGSGRFAVEHLQDMQQSSGSSHDSGKTLVTAALAKMGLTLGRSAKGFVGLSNLGNTCFANSIMQCLVAIPELVACFLTAAASGEQGKPSGPVSGAFGSLVQQLWASSGSSIDPHAFMKACGSHDKAWKDGRQHDAQEFLRSILEAMQTELNRVKGKVPYKELKGEGPVNAQADEAWNYAHSRSNSVIQDIFAGQLQSTLQCPACGALSHTFDEIMDLSLPLPQKPSVSVRSAACTIQECLDEFTETETLEEEEGYNCQACKRKGVCATKKLTLYRCPPVLVLHLKRFSSSTGSLGMFSSGRFSAMSKDTTHVDVVADELDLSPYCSAAARKQLQPPLYRLAAVTNHSGSMAGGHYTAQCRSFLDEKWYDCNDSSVREDKCVEGPSGSAYVLFYRRQD